MEFDGEVIDLPLKGFHSEKHQEIYFTQQSIMKKLIR